MTVCGGNKGNLSPPAHLPLPSSSVSGMGGMSSVPCARERAELVRAWWVTASGSGVAICGDTGTKLDRPVPAGFETGPARDPGKSPRAGCPGHHHQTFKSGHDVRRASRTPLIAPGRKLVEDFVLGGITTHCFPRIYSGVWRRFRYGLSRTPARGPGKTVRVACGQVLSRVRKRTLAAPYSLTVWRCQPGVSGSSSAPTSRTATASSLTHLPSTSFASVLSPRPWP